MALSRRALSLALYHSHPMNVLVVVQARLRSTRLPRKVLMDLGGQPVLQRVVERAQRAGYPVTVALPAEDLDPRLRECGLVARCPGPEIDVLGRYAYLAPIAHQLFDRPPFDIIVRLTADCPCLDPRLIVRAVEAVKAGHDYAGNTVERHWPRGLDVECFTTELLQKAHEAATDSYDREHVTPWMQRWASNPYAMPRTAEDDIRLTNAYRWCLDTPADLLWLQRAFERFPDPTTEQLLSLPPHYD